MTDNPKSTDSLKKLKLGVILPHTKVFGGVKRFFELGNIFTDNGHQFIVFTPEGIPPSWFEYKGPVTKVSDLLHYTLDALFITEIEFLPLLRQSNAMLKIFYAVLERSYIKKILRDKDILILANSTSLFHYLGGDGRTNLAKAIGGIDTDKFHFKAGRERDPNAPFIVMVYGRFYKKKKGTMLVVRACERLCRKGYNIKLHLFDSPTDEYSEKKLKLFKSTMPYEFFINYPVKDMAELYYKADVFVSAERNAGWSNTSAEAMACGVPVIATRSGTQDFLFDNETGLCVWRFSFFIRRALEKLINDKALAARLARKGREKISEYSWIKLADFIEQYISERV